jgi:hypothetical protein
LPAIGARSTNRWEGHCLLPYINSCLDNSVIHMFNHVQRQI